MPNTIRHESGDALHFVISSGATQVVVDNTGAPPQLFQANIPVVLVGHFVGTSDVFSSDHD